jgi:hypothetical protein
LTFWVGGGRFHVPKIYEKGETQAMSAEPPQKLLAKWQQGDLTVEQAIGQLLQHLVALHKLLDDLKRQLLKLLPKDKK